MSVEHLDRSWPKPLPAIEEVREIFDDVLGYDTIVKFNNPTKRLEAATIMALRAESFSTIRRRLHRKLSVAIEYNDSRLSGRMVQRAPKAILPFHSFNGLHYHEDIRLRVMPSLQGEIAAVIYGEEDSQLKLDRVAACMGVVTAESQSLSDANTRVARTVHDYLQRGRKGLNMRRVTDTSLHFSPPPIIEDLIMDQSVSRLIEHPDEDPLGPEGIRSFSPRAADTIASSAMLLGNLYLDDDYENGTELRDRVDEIIPHNDTEQALMTRSVLTQKKYSVAAWAVAFPDRQPGIPLSEVDAQILIEANYNLMRMRVASLALGVLRGGDFISVEKDSYGRDRSFGHLHWWPPASF